MELHGIFLTFNLFKILLGTCKSVFGKLSLIFQTREDDAIHGWWFAKVETKYILKN